MKLFWRHGYEATSLTELTTAMGITPPSLYTAFGDKKRLFREAVAAYISGPVTSDSIIDQAPTAKAAAYGLLEASAIGFTGTDTPPGCLLAAGAIACSPEAEDIRAELSAIRRQVEHRLTAKIAACPGMSVADPEALAAHVMAVIQGMSTLARDGATREKLLRIARIAMAAWPA
jgi:AcrR family transcriptional regulator